MMNNGNASKRKKHNSKVPMAGIIFGVFWIIAIGILLLWQIGIEKRQIIEPVLVFSLGIAGLIIGVGIDISRCIRREKEVETQNHILEVPGEDRTEEIEKSVEGYKNNGNALFIMEEELNKTRRELKQAQVYLDIAGVMFIVLNTRGEITLTNRKVCDILGYKQEEILGKNWFENFIPARMRDDVKQVFSLLMSGEIDINEYHENPVVAKNGEERIIAWRNTLLKDEEGNISGTLSSGTDVTSRKESERQLKQSLEEKRVLLREIHHRVKNNLAIIIGLLNIHKMKVREEDTTGIIELESRIRTMSMIHERLYQGERLDRIEFAHYVAGLMSYLIQAFKPPQIDCVFSVDIRSIFFNIETAIPCGLIINELVTNSLKYAFTEKSGRGSKNDCEKPVVHVSIVRHKDGGGTVTRERNSYRLRVSDNGKGMPLGFQLDECESMGLKLVQMMVAQLDGKINVSTGEGGVTVEIDFLEQ